MDADDVLRSPIPDRWPKDIFLQSVLVSGGVVYLALDRLQLSFLRCAWGAISQQPPTLSGFIHRDVRT